MSRPIEVWADVGGTFTDCFVVTPQSRRSLKLLSSGRVRAAIISVRADRVTVGPGLDAPDDFWVGAEAVVDVLIDDRGRGGGGGKGHDVNVPERSHGDRPGGGRPRVIGFDRSRRVLRFDRDVATDFSGPGGDTLELDAGLEAPVLATRRLLGIPLGHPLPPLDIRLGTTRGTNALLTRRGAPVALVTTRGFGDLLEIGEQTRPELFALTIRKPEPLTRHVVEADERLDAAGQVLQPLDEPALLDGLRRVRKAGIESLAVCLLHAYVNDVHERRIAELAAEVGFENISLSSQVAPLIKLVARGETTVLDAYLTPVIDRYVRRLRQQFTGDSTSAGSDSTTRLRLMTSGGNLVDADAFRGCDSILSGPAGGVVALGKIAQSHGLSAAIGLDMGGTSTDVSRFAGRPVRQYESYKAGVRVLTPMMAIHTVAAGGGSICDCVAGRLIVGPQSAGADPGPACYGRGGPLTVTDLNVVLGRLPATRFPFPLDVNAAQRRLAEVNAKLGAEALPTIEAAAEGLLRIAINHMAEAVRTVSTAEGSDPRGMTLVGFGGAAGGHLCGIADAIGITHVLDHRDASLLSALGIGLADVGRVRSVGVYRPLADLDATFWRDSLIEIDQQVLDALSPEVVSIAAAEVRHEADLRYVGTESILTLPAEPTESLETRFHQAHQAAFGYDQRHRPVEVAVIRSEAIVGSASSLDPPDVIASSSESLTEVSPESDLPAAEPSAGEWSPSEGGYAIHSRTELATGSRLAGPCVVIDAASTLVIDRGWIGTKSADGSFELRRSVAEAPATIPGTADEVIRADVTEAADPVTVEVVARRFQGIADAMGESLRRTAVSVNVKERLDFSCAVFDRQGQLLANAPHVPVHLGAMGHTVRHLRGVFPEMFPGDVYLSNDPYAGGSHLPDVTVVTPVFCREATAPDFFVASRAHHAEIGGVTPGSMPPAATDLSQEGVVITSLALRRQGHEHEERLRALLTAGPHPSRSPEINLADIAAQRAAGVAGARRVVELVETLGAATVDASAARMLEQASAAVRRLIESLGNHQRRFRDTLDDGTEIAVCLTPSDGRLRIDFSGTAAVHPRGFNATPAIVTAATLYVLRTLIGGRLPMNGGITSPIDFVIPSGLLNPPRGATPSECPAVVAGNVETSMRIVDVLLGALGVAAASQGTMNNVLIGDSTFGYYETIGGGSGATADGPGADGVQCHMTNTRATDPEVFETRYPVRLWRFALRRGSGGRGSHRGGDGLIRELEFLRPLQLALITNRRGDHRPWGGAGGQPGQAGRNRLVTADGRELTLAAATTRPLLAGDRLVIETPGGGGWGTAGPAE